MPDKAGVRNVWTASMVIPRGVFDAIGGFRDDSVGGAAAVVVPKTPTCVLRAAAARPSGTWV